jgi:hypothetical protein
LGELVIHDPVLTGRRLVSNISVKEGLEQYIKQKDFFIEYDTEILAIDSILNIPIIATVLPLAWLSGSDIYVDKLDKTFKESMDQLQQYFKSQYPLVPFTTKIKTNELVENKISVKDSERRTGLLFSGGVDATYSMITNLQHKPTLIMHWGVERTPYPAYRDYWEMVRSTYESLAKKHGLVFHLTKTNVLDVLGERKIEHRYSEELFYGSLWVRLQHSLVLLSLAAPLSVNRFDRLLIAASEWPTTPETLDPNRPHAARPEADEKISWANLSVKHDGFIEKYRKIRAIVNYYKDENVVLRVCLNRKDAPRSMNCNICDKCSRTITQIIQAEVDPNKYGFKVDDSSPFDRYRKYIENHGLDYSSLNAKKILPETMDIDLYGSKEFFEWLRGFKLSEKEQELFYRDVYLHLPFPVAKVLNEIYMILGINIHFGNPNLPQERVEKIRGFNKPYDRTRVHA